MLFKKSGFPEENDIVICTVTKVHFNSVFANLDWFDKQGMIHISEISPGRIRNIRDYVKEGKVVVCKVLKINQERGHIDLSLRRVSEVQRRTKVEEMKQEQKAEKIIEFVAGKIKKDKIELYRDIFAKVSKEYEMLHYAFNLVVEDDISLEKLGLEKSIANALEEEIRQRIKPKEVSITGKFSVKSWDPDGVDVIKEAMKKGIASSENLDIKYGGAGYYNLSITAGDYPEAEDILKKVVDIVVSHMQKNNGEASFARSDD